MSSYEAIRRLRIFERIYCDYPKYGWKKNSLRKRSYAKTLISILISKIEQNPDADPVLIIRFLQSDNEDMMYMGENERTRAFCSHMSDIYKEILNRLI